MRHASFVLNTASPPLHLFQGLWRKKASSTSSSTPRGGPRGSGGMIQARGSPVTLLTIGALSDRADSYREDDLVTECSSQR